LVEQRSEIELRSFINETMPEAQLSMAGPVETAVKTFVAALSQSV
jgi:hypothetical protein